MSLFIPAKADTFRAMAELPHDTPEDPLETAGTVLVVEDDITVAELATAVLQDCGYTTTLVHCAKDALAVLTSGLTFDAVFSDIVMPGGVDGVMLAQTIRARWPAVPVLLTTGFAPSAVTDAAKRFPLLAKPYSPRELATRIKALIETRAGAS